MYRKPQFPKANIVQIWLVTVHYSSEQRLAHQRFSRRLQTEIWVIQIWMPFTLAVSVNARSLDYRPFQKYICLQILSLKWLVHPFQSGKQEDWRDVVSACRVCGATPASDNQLKKQKKTWAWNRIVSNTCQGFVIICFMLSRGPPPWSGGEWGEMLVNSFGSWHSPIFRHILVWFYKW